VYVRPHELEIVAEPAEGAWAATLSQTLTVGAHTRVEFRREGSDGAEGGYLDVELPRAEYQALRDRLALQRGSRVYLKPRRVTRFAVGEGAA
jgi:sulfate transport system ATP-binding protein